MAKIILLSEKKTMGQAKLMWLLLADIIGIPVTVLGIVANIDNIKSAILFLVALVYVLTRLYFYAVQKKQAVREKEMELWNKQMDNEERKRRIESR